MNQSASFAVEDMPTRRTSARARGMPILPAKCFKKVYRKREVEQPMVAPSIIQSANNQLFQSPQNENLSQLLKCASLLYTPVPQGSIQSKAITNYRVKKLKKTLRTQAEILRAIKEQRVPAKFGLNCILRAAKSNSRSLIALRRVRDSNGRFFNHAHDHTKSVSQIDTAIDSKDHSQTALESRPSLMSGCFEDFFTSHGSERADTISGDISPLNPNYSFSSNPQRSFAFEQTDNRRCLFSKPTIPEPDTQLGHAPSAVHYLQTSGMLGEEQGSQYDFALTVQENDFLGCLNAFDDFDFPELNEDYEKFSYSDSLAEADAN
jgi:hypothetical protein